jgi:hypothetical protein
VFVAEADGQRTLTSSLVIDGQRVWREDRQVRNTEEGGITYRTVRTAYWIESPREQYPTAQEAIAAQTTPAQSTPPCQPLP